LNRSAALFAARPTASCGGVALRVGGLGTIMTTTTITTPKAGTG
jgi:hypothetical protein